ncbi:MAG: phosphoglycerate dehydrogenase [Planctomycetota bacterium]|jgi:D-3-phosphoglycerate dehydrogenase|nr:phosphoglycerate dehydrogenase [Planctomycetota bacterium]
MSKPVVQVSTYPYGVKDPAPVKALEAAGFEVRLSPHGRKHTSAETAALLGDVDVLIAGTESLDAEVLARGLPRLKHVAKNGVGLDGVDFDFCKANNIAVTYTPEAPARSVVEQVFGILISLSRRFIEAHEGMRLGEWRRLTGPLWDGKTLGILGCGRIGKQVAEIAKAFRMEVIAHDIVEDHDWAERIGVRYVDIDTLFTESLGVTVHLPLDDSTRGIVSKQRLAQMRGDAYLLNTCRGPVVDEDALYAALKAKRIAGAAIDVYAKEPYTGPLRELSNVFLTAHQGSCSHDGRFQMEIGSATNAIRFHQGDELEPGNVVWLPTQD